MTRIEIKSRVGPDGVLSVTVPVDYANHEVVVTVEPVAAGNGGSGGDWSDFIAATAGRWSGERLVRPEQGNLEARRAWE